MDPETSIQTLGEGLAWALQDAQTQLQRIADQDVSTARRQVERLADLIALHQHLAKAHAEAMMEAQQMRDGIRLLKQEIKNRDHDELTGLRNLRWLRSYWDSLPWPAASVAAVVFADVDGLKKVNDTYGHTMGDRIIVHVAAGIVSSGCHGIRYGGDEFIVLVPTGHDAVDDVNAIIEAVEQPVPGPDGNIVVTMSLGIRIVDPHAKLHEMINEADRAMYQAKRGNGKQRYTIAHSADSGNIN